MGMLLLPGLLLLVGALVGLLGTLDSRVAWERLIGLVSAAMLAVLAGFSVAPSAPH